jgi:hypothetical protein
MVGMNADEIRGRFLPSRVFARWRWTVRCGLWIVPMLVLLAGGLRLYLSPSIYRSFCVFEIVNGPDLRETGELLRSDRVLDRVSDQLELPRRLGVDRVNCGEIIRKNLRTEVLPGTRMIRLDITLHQRAEARDIAAELPRSLVATHADSLRADTAAKVVEIDRLITAASDRARELSVEWIRLEEIHGGESGDPAAAAAIGRARTIATRAEAGVSQLSSLKQAEQTRLIGELPRLVVHTEALIPTRREPAGGGDELGRLVLHSLGWGLAVALLLPYLLELLFPFPAAAGCASPARSAAANW